MGDPMSDSLTDQANKKIIDDLKAAKPNQFTVGGHYQDGKIIGGAQYNRTWKNGWGATAYARAWWDDKAVTPQAKSGAVIGAEGVYKF